jgi:uracil phosphoribosyltransferase
MTYFDTISPIIYGRNDPKIASNIVHENARKNKFLYGFAKETKRLKTNIFMVAFSDMCAKLPKKQWSIPICFKSFSIYYKQRPQKFLKIHYFYGKSQTMVHNLSLQNSIFNTFLGEIRNVEIQKDAMRFRRNMERISEILAYEVSKSLTYTSSFITTPLGQSEVNLLKDEPVLATILRAGLPMHQGLLNYFDKAESAFISAYRKHTTAEEFDIHVEYLASPKLDNRTLIISDPMLATGSSMVMVYKALLKQGKPSKVIIVSAIATPEALAYVKRHLPESTEIWVGAIDKELTAQAYIVPGLGDAGDLAFGEKY